MKSHSTRLKLPANPERAFFYFLTIVFAAVFIQVVATNPAARQPLRLLAFALLLNIHIFIHWQIIRVEGYPGRERTYLLGQGILALGICLISGSLGMIFALYLALIGQAVGIYSQRRREMAASVGYFIVLSLLSYGLIFGWNTLHWWALAVLPLTLFVYIYVTLYQRQIQAREQAQALLAELETANKQLTEYAARVEDLTITAERQRMARELHDTLSQGLAGIILQLEAVDAHLTNSRSDRAQAIVKQAMEQARTTLADARRAIDDLRKGSSGEDISRRLVEIVHQEAERFTATSGIPCDVEINLPGELPETVSEIVQRAIQESLTNIARHAHATQASLRMAADQNQLVLEVRDDGCGFEPQAAEGQPGHYGLMGMGERARLSGGTLEVNSAPGKGCRITLTLPLAGKDRTE